MPLATVHKDLRGEKNSSQDVDEPLKPDGNSRLPSDCLASPSTGTITSRISKDVSLFDDE
jgi:hypothetical protein